MWERGIDNGPMEGFWGILKRERYYGRRFTSREELVGMIEDYITYYNSRRLQRNLGVLTPMDKPAQFLAAYKASNSTSAIGSSESGYIISLST